MGGFYSICLAQKYSLKAILINPAVNSFDTLKKYEGLNKSYFDGSSFEMKFEYLEYLKSISTQNVSDQESYLLMLQKGDELLDYTKALKLLPKAKIILEDNGSHSFENIENHFDVIGDFISD